MREARGGGGAGLIPGASHGRAVRALLLEHPMTYTLHVAAWVPQLILQGIDKLGGMRRGRGGGGHQGPMTNMCYIALTRVLH